MKLDDVIAAHIGALMPPDGPSAAEAVVGLFDAILSDVDAIDREIALIRHTAEMPLLQGELVMHLERVVDWESWAVLHRDRFGKLKSILRWEAMATEEEA